MSSKPGIAYITVTADTLVSTEPVLLYGAVILASALGGDATIYDGHDASSGRKVITLKGGATLSTPVEWPQGLYLGGGLYVDVGSNVTEVQLSYEPIS